MRFKKLVALCLIAVLSLSAAAPAVYADETITTDTTTDTSTDNTVESEPTAEPVVYNPITPGKAASFTPNVDAFKSHKVTLPANTEYIVQKIKMAQKGYLYIPVSIMGTEQSIYVELYSDAACTAKVGYSVYLDAYSLSDELYTSIPAAGTYYLKIYPSYGTLENDVEVTLTPYCYSSANNRTLTANKYMYSYSGNSTSTMYHKVVVKKTGYITVTGESDGYYGSLNITLYNASKKAISDELYLSPTTNNGKASFAVQKGTYFIGVKSSDKVRLKYNFTAVTDKSGATKKKATLIPKGYSRNGLVMVANSLTKYDWFKVKLTKSQILSLTINTKGSGNIMFEVIPASSNVTIYGNSFYLGETRSATWETYSKVPAGTYYIKVYKGTKNMSGFYSIKFNK